MIHCTYLKAAHAKTFARRLVTENGTMRVVSLWGGADRWRQGDINVRWYPPREIIVTQWELGTQSGDEFVAAGDEAAANQTSPLAIRYRADGEEWDVFPPRL